MWVEHACCLLEPLFWQGTAAVKVKCGLVVMLVELLFGAVGLAQTFDIVIYGGTCSGITAAIQAKRMGKSVVLVCPETHLGGLTISGLGWTDTKDANCIGGLAREFYHRIWQYYNDPDKWIYQSRGSYNPGWQAGPAVQNASETMWTFEPHVAEAVYEQWLAEEQIAVVRNRWLDRAAGGVTRQGNRITSIKTLKFDADFGFSAAETYTGRMFIDASYEGDLMASSGVSYRIGRDARSEYGETLNGIYFTSSNLSPGNSPYKGVDPYVVPGDPSSGFIAGIEGEFTDFSLIGQADSRLQAFNFRMCLTDVAANRVAIPKPHGYDESQYELLFRLYEAGQNPGFTTQRMPNLKCDNNNSGLMSLDWPGGNFSIKDGWVYSEASYVERMDYIRRQRDYQQGLLWTMLYHPRVPESIRASRAKWGLSKDEFTDNEYWPYFSYVREARRLEGEMVMTEHHVKMAAGYGVPDSVGQGSYSLDSHVVRRVVIDGTIWNEGGFYQWWSDGYPISYRSILPRQQQAANLLVPVCLSASHAAFGSIRMEPTYMILGQSAATAAALAIDYDYAVQEVPYALLRTHLLQDGQRLGNSSYSSAFSSVLLNFGAVISDDQNSPAHTFGGSAGTGWNLITADKTTGITASDGTPTNIRVNLGKTQPDAKVVEWDRHGFVNSSLGADYSTGVYAGNARSALYVSDGAGSRVALGIRISGLDAGIYSLYTVAVNTNTTAKDSYNIYAFPAEAASGDIDYSAARPVKLANTRQSDAWVFGSNFAAPVVSLTKGKDLVVVVEGLADAGYRAFLNTLEIVQLVVSPLSPVITVQPQSVEVCSSADPQCAGPAVFSCEWKSASASTVTWLKMTDGGVIDLGQLSDPDIRTTGPEFDSASQTYRSGLVISDPDVQDSGRYLCAIENADGKIFSNPAECLVKEMLAYWTLDAADYGSGRYTDVSGHNRHVTVNGAPVFQSGADNSDRGAVQVSSGSGWGTIGAWNPSAQTGQISLSAWVYWTGGSATSIIIDKANAWDASQMMWTWGINPSTQKINFVCSGSSDFQTSFSQTGFAPNQWHHLAVTHDASGRAELYVDTRRVSAGMLVMGSKTDAVLRLGTDYSGRTFQGMLDDVRIYNHVLDEKGILDAYNGAAAVKKNICLEGNLNNLFDLTGPQGSSDCVVDLYDLAVFMSNWLSCGLYPAAACEND